MATEYLQNCKSTFSYSSTVTTDRCNHDDRSMRPVYCTILIFDLLEEKPKIPLTSEN